MKKLTLTSFLFLIFISLLALPARLGAQGVTSSSLGGTVTDASGNPVVGAAITAVDTSSNTRYTSASRTGGRWDISSVRTGGPYRVTATANGASKSVSGIFTTLEQTTDVNLQLGGAGPQERAPAAVTNTEGTET